MATLPVHGPETLPTPEIPQPGASTCIPTGVAVTPTTAHVPVPAGSTPFPPTRKRPISGSATDPSAHKRKKGKQPLKSAADDRGKPYRLFVTAFQKSNESFSKLAKSWREAGGEEAQTLGKNLKRLFGEKKLDSARLSNKDGQKRRERGLQRAAGCLKSPRPVVGQASTQAHTQAPRQDPPDSPSSSPDAQATTQTEASEVAVVVSTLTGSPSSEHGLELPIQEPAVDIIDNTKFRQSEECESVQPAVDTPPTDEISSVPLQARDSLDARLPFGEKFKRRVIENSDQPEGFWVHIFKRLSGGSVSTYQSSRQSVWSTRRQSVAEDTNGDFLALCYLFQLDPVTNASGGTSAERFAQELYERIECEARYAAIDDAFEALHARGQHGITNQERSVERLHAINESDEPQMIAICTQAVKKYNDTRRALVNLRTAHGVPALHLAVKLGFPEACGIMLWAGADHMAKTASSLGGLDAYHHAGPALRVAKNDHALFWRINKCREQVKFGLDTSEKPKRKPRTEPCATLKDLCNSLDKASIRVEERNGALAFNHLVDYHGANSRALRPIQPLRTLLPPAQSQHHQRSPQRNSDPLLDTILESHDFSGTMPNAGLSGPSGGHGMYGHGLGYSDEPVSKKGYNAGTNRGFYMMDGSVHTSKQVSNDTGLYDDVDATSGTHSFAGHNNDATDCYNNHHVGGSRHMEPSRDNTPMTAAAPTSRPGLWGSPLEIDHPPSSDHHQQLQGQVTAAPVESTRYVDPRSLTLLHPKGPAAVRNDVQQDMMSGNTLSSGIPQPSGTALATSYVGAHDDEMMDWMSPIIAQSDGSTTLGDAEIEQQFAAAPVPVGPSTSSYQLNVVHDSSRHLEHATSRESINAEHGQYTPPQTSAYQFGAASHGMDMFFAMNCPDFMNGSGPHTSQPTSHLVDHSEIPRSMPALSPHTSTPARSASPNTPLSDVPPLYQGKPVNVHGNLLQVGPPLPRRSPSINQHTDDSRSNQDIKSDYVPTDYQPAIPNTYGASTGHTHDGQSRNRPERNVVQERVQQFESLEVQNEVWLSCEHQKPRNSRKSYCKQGCGLIPEHHMPTLRNLTFGI
ncbi:hypothetical protein LTR17_021424 [Elasticomyces elasticus]|nr:hypothetical protein LTR17_021424 [Elasticomyces elasticus]